ncbi:hypothetical protein O181_095053 [Austropuccinia psidii MF-1]|uniref:Uncharacterized protein n=1 Tax=Austropuccinia psidii MF-1 TaxID=1389203 RepID=A0A9Q3J355_9BASI|nr:hypothetical protein [Austropuccinia psidii MF-1]
MHTWVALAWILCKALAKQGMIKQLYCLTGDNAANNVTMTTVLQEKFAGIGIQWPKNKRFHHCACHILNLVEKELLAYMGQLTNYDYKFFDDYLGLKQAPIEDSNDEGPLGSVVFQTTIKNVCHSLGHKYKKGCSQELNQPTLETQDKSADVAYLVDQAFKPKSIEADQSQSQTSSDKMVVRILRELCSRIRGSAKQRDCHRGSSK